MSTDTKDRILKFIVKKGKILENRFSNIEQSDVKASKYHLISKRCLNRLIRCCIPYQLLDNYGGSDDDRY